MISPGSSDGGDSVVDGLSLAWSLEETGGAGDDARFGGGDLDSLRRDVGGGELGAGSEACGGDITCKVRRGHERASKDSEVRKGN